MNIYLYKTADEPNRLEKTMTDEIALTGSLREECDILTPTLTIANSVNMSEYNYMHIPEYGRYYFIKTINIVRTRLWEITAEVDPLMSYADKIKALPAIAGRNSNKTNYYLPDNLQKVYADARVQTKLFPKGFSGATYILTTAGGN